MIDPEEVLRILKMADPDRLMVTGGQALNLWAERYHHAPELAAYAPYISKDVDFHAQFNDAAALAAKLGGYMLKPSSDGLQPWVEGIIVVPRPNGEDLRIDVLNNVLGTNPKDVLKSSVRVHLLSKQTGEKITVTLMHPFHVLQSRIANVLGVANSDAPEDSSRKRQAKAAPVILREYLREMSRLGQTDDVMGTLRQLGEWLRRDTNGKQVRNHVDYDPRLILEEHLGNKKLPDTWREKNLRSLLASIDAYRAGQATRAAERAARRRAKDQDQGV